MTRSMFTAAIEEHLAMKKQNAHLNATLPLERFDVGDPLDRYPGGPVRPAVEDAATDTGSDAGAAAPVIDEVEARRPLEPLNGMVATLSLVEDLDDDAHDGPTIDAFADPVDETQVLQFPGAQPASMEAPEDRWDLEAPAAPRQTLPPLANDMPQEDEPVIVIDTTEPLAPEFGMSILDEPRRSKSRFPRFKRKSKKEEAAPVGGGWFASESRDFDWGDR